MLKGGVPTKSTSSKHHTHFYGLIPIRYKNKLADSPTYHVKLICSNNIIEEELSIMTVPKDFLFLKL